MTTDQKLEHGTNRFERWLYQGAIITILLIFGVLAIAYSVVNPLFEGTDELRHYRFVRTIATSGRLPVQGQEPCRSQSHHPPLFYGIAAAATAWIDTGRGICDSLPTNPFWGYRYWEVGTDNKNIYLHGPAEEFPWSGEALAAHLIRITNILLGSAVVYLTWLIGRIIWPRQPALALGAVAFVAFNPMFLYMSATINNDVIAALAGTAVIYACIRLLSDPQQLSWRWGIIFGLTYGFALLSKFNLSPIILLIEATLVWVIWGKNLHGRAGKIGNENGDTGHIGKRLFRHRLRLFLSVNALMLLLASLMAGWWFVRNLNLYGDPTGFQAVTELWGVRDPVDSFGLAVSELPYAWSTLWGRFGFGQIPMPALIYDGLKIVGLVGLTGALVGFVRPTAAKYRPMLTVLIANVLLFFAVLFNYMLVSPAGPNGRFFFPALSSLALLLFFGLAQWTEIAGSRLSGRSTDGPESDNDSSDAGIPDAGIPDAGWRYVNALAVLANVSMLILSLFALVAVVGAAYAQPKTLKDESVIENRVDAHFDSLVTLLGYDIDNTAIVPGESVDLTLYWQVNNKPPGNYLLFAHLINEDGVMVTQRDTHPGLGNFPSSRWETGDRFVDEISIAAPVTAYAPQTATLSIGLYAPGSYRLPISDSDDSYIGDALALTTIHITPSPGLFPNTQDHNFNHEIRLLGYEYSTLSPELGNTLEVTLYWEALVDIERDYIVQVRLVDDQEKIWAGADSRPQDKASATNTWKAGQLTADTHRLVIDPETPFGAYAVEIALKDDATGRRQIIVGDDGHWIDSKLLLAPVWVGPQEER